MKKKFRLSELLVSFCFLVFLFGCMAVTVTREKAERSYYENRSLARIPVYTAQGDGDGSYAGQWETYLSDHAALRNTLLRAKTGLDLALRRPVVNEIVPTQGYFLPYVGYQKADRAEIAARAEAVADSLADTQELVESLGGQFCCAAVPNQYVYFAEMYPGYMDRDFPINRLNVELLSAALSKRGVNFLDLGAEVDALGHPEDYISKVDHHNTMRGAFLNYQLILNKLSALSGETLHMLGEEDFDVETLPNPYLGSRTRKLLGLVPAEERVQLLLPREEVPFTRTDGGQARAPAVYDRPGNDQSDVTYEVYMGGDMAQTTIETNRPELPSTLIYGSSYTNAVECILYLSFDRMDSLDLRYYGEMSLADYIRESRPDYVVCLRDYMDLMNEPTG